jgi:hypothetical protein
MQSNLVAFVVGEDEKEERDSSRQVSTARSEAKQESREAEAVWLVLFWRIVMVSGG